MYADPVVGSLAAHAERHRRGGGYGFTRGEWRAVPPFAGEDNPVIMAVWHGPAHGVCVFQRS
ncbi:hypothetical protein LOF13_14105 [Klebsiella pneumoniae subsp. pneumoniae]|nr:hypothetical protein LOF13_14105 [Klebsiella pneumoniae subsp. pneumoniae]